MNAKQIVVGYLAFQAASVAAWWLLLICVPPSIGWFKPVAWPSESLLCFLLPDSVMLIFGSAATAYAIATHKAWGTVLVWATAAAVWYPTLYCLGVSIVTDEAWIATAMMVSMAGLTLAMATIHGVSGQQPAAIRVTEMSPSSAIGWTMAQTVIFWSVFLWILPKAILELEHHLGGHSFSHSYQTLASSCLFAIASITGLLSGITMATAGHGTPLPTATAPALVIAGPYRYVRNPMALAGIVQGVAVGWFLGSFSIILYSITGALVWHVFVRPVEEADLLDRFGKSYSQYKQAVPLWFPLLTPFRQIDLSNHN